MGCEPCDGFSEPALEQPADASCSVHRWGRRKVGGLGPSQQLWGLGLSRVWGISRQGPSWSLCPRPLPAAPRPSPGQAAGASQAKPLGTVTHSSRPVLTEPTSPSPRPPGSPPEGGWAQTPAPCSPEPHTQLPVPLCPVAVRAPTSPTRKPRLREGHHLPTDSQGGWSWA